MTLTTAQLQTLKADIAANTSAIPAGQPWTGIYAGVQVKNVPATGDGNVAVAGWYNQPAAPAYWVWQPSSSQTVTGAAVKMSDVGNLTTANSTRLQVSFQIRPNGFTPSAQDDRALFGSLFSVAGASGTRANLLTAWQRQASFVEKLFATGTGAQATGDLNSDGTLTVGAPATLVVIGPVTDGDVENARNS